MNEFQDKLTAKVSANMEQSGFDPSILIPLILEYLTDILGSCASSESIKKKLQNPNDFWVKYSVRKAVKAAAMEGCCDLSREEQQTIGQLVLQTCGECSDSELDDLLNEVEDNTSYILI